MPENSVNMNKKPLILEPLEVYLNTAQEKYRSKNKLAARVMALVLPLFEMKSAVKHTLGTVFRIPGCVIKIPLYVVLFFSPESSLAFKASKVLAHFLPGPIDLLKSASKATFCWIGIFVAPVVGIINPEFNVKVHALFGLVKEKEKESVDKGEAIEEKIIGKEPYSEEPTGFDAIIGMDEVKEKLQMVLNSLKYSEFAKAYGIGLPNGIMLEGPPGCGKTFFAHKLAEEAEKQLGKRIAFHTMSPSSVGSAKIHETSKNISEAFLAAEESAKKNQSFSILFIDEIDSLFSKSEDVASYRQEERGEVLQQLNDAGGRNILVIGATNHLDQMDEAVIRSGRFDCKIHIPCPDTSMRQQLLKSYLSNVPVAEDVNYEELAGKLEGRNIADMKALTETARRIAFQKAIRQGLEKNVDPAIIPIDNLILAEATASISSQTA